MIQNTLAEIEARLRQADSVKPTTRAELLDLLATLRSEVGSLSQTHSEQAKSIAGFTTVSAHEATRDKKNPELVDLSLKGLASSVAGFEKSHPKLVEVVNRICTTLANLGI
jgi:hypothetical protein